MNRFGYLRLWDKRRVSPLRLFSLLTGIFSNSCLESQATVSKEWQAKWQLVVNKIVYNSYSHFLIWINNVAVTWRMREMSQGRAPECANSTIFCLVASGKGRPFTKTPPNWLTPLWPVDQSETGMEGWYWRLMSVGSDVISEWSGSLRRNYSALANSYYSSWLRTLMLKMIMLWCEKKRHPFDIK